MLILLSTYFLNLTFYECIIFTGCLIGFFIGSLGNLNFGMICAHDFQRRATTLKKLGQLIQYPGLRLSEFLFHSPHPEEKNKDSIDDKTQKFDLNEQNDPHLYIDIKQPANVFAWMICRKTLRSFGEAFYLRIQAYTSILLSYAVLCVLFLNLVAWTQMRHHVSTIWLLIITVVTISSICIFAISKATKLQALSSIQRDQVQKELFFLEKELMDADEADNTLEFKQISHAKVLLQQVDESINFQNWYTSPRSLQQGKTGILGNCVFATFSKNIKQLTSAGCQSEIPPNSSQLLSIQYESEVLLPICYQIFEGVPDKGVEKYFARMGSFGWCLTVKN